jgi:multicomponent K+:H+ antiporter subunit C
MEALIALAIGGLTAGAVYLMLQRRSFPVILGLTLLSYAVNIFLFISGRVALDSPAIIGMGPPYTDPLPQALVLTAIVISFGMTAVILLLALGSFLHSGDDLADASEGEAKE